MGEESQDSESRELRRVLIVDPSKVVRSALARHLREHFDVREEADGESAWQSLVLDPTIIAVVSATQLPRLNGLDLLARIRVSKLRRICDIPFLLLMSGSESIEDRLHAQETGVTDFLTRGMSREEILERIGRLVTWEFATNLTDSNIMPTVVQHNAPIATPKTEPQAANVSRLDLRANLDVALATHATSDGMVGVIAFGLDNAGSLAQTYGQKTLATITKRLGKILLVKLGANDSIHSDETGRCFIVSPGTSHASCTAFAQRVCRGLANSQIAIGGTPLNFKTSAGIACAPADNAIAGGDLLTLAAKRLQRAHEAGGTRIIADDRPEPGFILSADFLSGLTRLGSDSAGGAPLGALGLHLMPVFKALEKEFEFGLPLDLIESTCTQRAKDEQEG